VRTDRPTREPFTLGEYRGYRYRDCPPELIAKLPEWLRLGRCPEGEGGEDLQGGRVFGWNELVLKFGGPANRWRDVLRPSSSLRSADLHQRLLPIRTPHPVLAIERRAGRTVTDHVLVSERIRGRFLDELWGSDPAACEAFVDFLIGMARRRVYHGDLHVWNCMWDGREWVLMDLESLRHPLRRLRKRHLLLGIWSRISWDLGQPPELQPFFERFCSELGLRDVAAGWRTVAAESARLEALHGSARERRAEQTAGASGSG